MIHELVIPSDLKEKLDAASADKSVISKWKQINIETVDDLQKKIIECLNETYPKLNIKSVKIEDKKIIKKQIKNPSRVSMFAGYFVNETGVIDALFFYIDPLQANANDFLASKIPPVLLGIYKNSAEKKVDLHFNNMPVYVVSICSSSRPNNASVKQQIICAETIGINYIDIFNNRIYDIINEGEEDVKKEITNLKELDDLISKDGQNDAFKVDYDNKILHVICENALGRKNDTAYIYRWFLKCIPAVYIAAKDEYTIDISEILLIDNEDFSLIRDYIKKFPKTV